VRWIGIDAGGSGTRAVLLDDVGQLVMAGRGGPSGVIGGAAGRRLLERALQAALAPIAPLARDQACWVHLGLRGLSLPGRQAAALVAIQRLLPGAHVHVSNDAAVALEGGLGGQPGVAVLAGTGSIALTHAADGREGRAGGYGLLLSDEGSAAWLGRQGLTAWLRALDGRGPHTDLAASLGGHIGGSTAQAVISWLYSSRDQPARLAGLAPLVTKTAADGDAVASDIVGQAAEALAELAAAAARQVWPTVCPKGLAVARCGGVWAAGALLDAPFVARLGTLLPGAVPVWPRLPPVGGALLLAAAASGQPVEPALLDRLAAALVQPAS